MAEKRQPHFVFLLRKQGKNNLKLELFNSLAWLDKSAATKNWGGFACRKYRIRVNGKWFNEVGYRYTFYTRYEVRDLIWRSFKNIF